MKKQNMKCPTLGTALSVLSILLLGATAQARPGGQDGFGPLLHGKAAKELNLTGQQKEKLKKIRESAKKDSEKQRSELKAAREELRKLMKSNASDGDIRKQFDTVQNKQNELAKNRFDRMLEVRAILTSEQRERLSSMFEQKMKRHEGKGGKWRRGHKHDADESEEE